MHKNSNVFIWEEPWSLLEQKSVREFFLRKCSGNVRSTKVFVGRCKGWHLEIILLGNKIFLGKEGKRTCSQLKIGLSTEATNFLLLGVFCLLMCFKRYVKTCRKRFNSFEATLWKDVPKRSWVFRPAQILVWMLAKTELTC